MHRLFAKIVFILLALILSQPVFTQEINSSKLDSFLFALAKNNKAFGQLVFSQNSNIIYERSFGYRTNYEVDKNKINNETKFWIGSVSKVYTAVIIYQLIQENKLKLDTKLSEYFPEIKYANDIQIRDMLNHHSGIFNFSDDPNYRQWRLKPISQDKLLAKICAGAPAFYPRSNQRYSNSNFILLAWIAEKICSKTFPEIVEDRISKIIGAMHTSKAHKINSEQNEALAYQWENQWKAMPQTDMSIPGGAGGIASNAHDMSLFIDALFDGRLIHKNYLDTMILQDNGFGYGLFEYHFENQKCLGHTGGIDGFSSFLAYFPDEKLSISFCSNALAIPMNDILISALKIRFNRPFQVPDFKPYAHTRSELDSMCGVYSCRSLQLDLIIRRKGNSLEAQATKQSPFLLENSGPNHFQFNTAGIQMEFFPADHSMQLLQRGRTFLFEKKLH